MTRLERTTQFYWQLAQLARHDTFLDLVVRGLDGLAVVARTAPSHRLRRAAAAHVGVAARAHRFLNADPAGAGGGGTDCRAELAGPLQVSSAIRA
ncbi:hypothetical protein [Nitrospirillum sp. BR 11163]|uniref:hypothetical protein n=1 Tax=Nitrospirillum sp. BR 11163 TaxID=3104323 RepID=UPI002AFF50FF|nr:hypothetical protein [Nitrospirillum sp. BR 11163]MEA1673036.1 hypothetical protein [Nitrospirillum sp. BR 11163]